MSTPLEPEIRARIEKAKRRQVQLRARVVTEDRLGPVRYVAGLDVHFASDPKSPGRPTLAFAAAAAFELPALRLTQSALISAPVDFPYLPGFLSFREAPAMLAAFARLPHKPDLLLVDGQGLAHPRRCGLACHIGVLADVPAVGVGKSRLLGRAAEPAARGAWTPLIDRDEVVGAVLRSRAAIKPLYVSIGHRVSLATAIDWVLRTAPRYRLPEPLRAADRLSRCH